jgi:penicillin-binding protein 1A
MLGVTLLVFFFLWKFTPDLPSYSDLKSYYPPLSTRVFTADGRLLDEYFIEERLFVPIDKIPKKLINAFISAEDKNFYSHLGIDLFAIVRATLTNISNYGSQNRLVGASTITQQVVKNFLLTNELSFERKIKEIILAVRIEQVLSKDSILELYLNDIYLGYGSYGVAAASLNYFNKSLIELNLEEMAYLASLPKAPNNYHPVKKYKNAIARRNWVLDQMKSNKYISLADLKAKNNDLIVIKRELISPINAEYFREDIRKYLYNTYGEKFLYEEGLVVKTTLDTLYQNLADEALINGLMKYDKRHGWRGSIINIAHNVSNRKQIKKIKNPFNNKWKLVIIKKVKQNSLYVDYENNESDTIKLSDNNNWLANEEFKIGDVFFVELVNNEIIVRQIPKVNGAIIVIDPHSGKILALSGGFSFKLSEFNRATQAKRQSGSAFKPFVYMSALKEGFTPSTLILDAPYVIDQGPGLPKWKPSNYTEKFYGLSTMRLGIEKSRNLMTIRLADRIGMSKILKTAKDFNIHQGLDNNMSMALGAGVVTLKNLTNAYAMIVNSGKKIEPKLIQSIYNRRGKLIFNNEEKKCLNCNQINSLINYELPIIEKKTEYIINPTIAYQMTSMLEGVVQRGTGKKISDLNIPLAGKTGTTNQNKDAWFIGFSPDLVVGVYVGYDNPKTLGYKETGSSVAAPIFKYFMNKALMNKNKIPFRIAPGISFVKIDLQTGLQTDSNNGIMEAYKQGTEPFNNNVTVINNLGSVTNSTLSGTGNLLID